MRFRNSKNVGDFSAVGLGFVFVGGSETLNSVFNTFGMPLAYSLFLIRIFLMTLLCPPSAMCIRQCKHILAAYLCQAMGQSQQEQVSDQDMSRILAGQAASDS